MKRITLFIASLSSGGAEHQLCILAKFLKEKGYDVTMVNYSDTDDHYQLLEGIDRKRLAYKKNRILKTLMILGYFLFVKTDVVISFGQRDNFFALIPLMLRRKIKVIAGERNVTNDKPNIYEKWLMFYLYKRADFVVPNSYSQRDYILNKKPQWEKKVITITNYTDINLYMPTRQAIVDNNIVSIAIFSRLVAQKNCIRFAEVVKILKSRIGQNIVFSWFGNLIPKGEANVKYLQSLRSIIEQYEIKDMFILHDHVKDVSAVIGMYDAICLPSLKEGFSNSISEAICAGKPLLVSDISDNKVMVHDGENGYLFDPTSVEQMVEAVEKFYYLPIKLKSQMGKRSREIAENLFQKEKFINSYIELIER